MENGVGGAHGDGCGALGPPCLLILEGSSNPGPSSPARGSEGAISPFLLLASAYSWPSVYLGRCVELLGEDVWVPRGAPDQPVLGEEGILSLQGGSGASVGQHSSKLQAMPAQCGQTIHGHVL